MCDRLNTRSTPILAQRPEPHRWPPPILCALIRTLCRAAPYMQYLVHHHRRAPNSAGCTKCIYGIRAKYPAAWEPLGCTEPPKVRWMEARLDSDCTACIQAQLQCVVALHLHSSVVALCMCRSAAAYRSSFTSGRECSCTRIWTRHTDTSESSSSSPSPSTPSPSPSYNPKYPVM